MEVEAFVSPLELRRDYLNAKQFVKLLHRPENDKTARILNVISGNNDNLPAQINKCIVTNVTNKLTEFGFNSWKRTMGQIQCPLPPWTNLDQNLSCDMLSNNEEDMGRITFHELLDNEYCDFNRIFTDGSRVEHPIISVSSGVFYQFNDTARSWKLHPEHSVLAAEMFAIKEALFGVELENPGKYVIFTDSKSAVYSLLSNNPVCSELVYAILEQMLKLITLNYVIKIQWVKAHCGIKGNEIADLTAKMGHKINKSVYFPLIVQEKYTKLRREYIAYWDRWWKEKVNLMARGRFLRQHRAEVKRCEWTYSKNRRTEVVMSRLRIGHVGVNEYLHRLNMIESALCPNCQEVETIDHFLLRCPKYAISRDALIVTVNKLNVDFTSNILLGGGDHEVYKKKLITQALARFLIGTGEIH